MFELLHMKFWMGWPKGSFVFFLNQLMEKPSLPWWLSAKEFTSSAGEVRDVGLILRRSSGKRKWQSTPAFLLGKSHR